MATIYEQKKYEQSDAVKKAQESLEAIAGQKPGAYQSQYQPKIQTLTDQILNRGPFQYDLNGDALYNQYKDRYVGLGQQAMMDTMGQAAKLTGGYGNSYAQLAGQQAYHGYLQGLNDKVPELYQLALQRYNQEGQDLYNRYGLLSSQEEQAYNRFMNNYNMWNAERDWLAGRYDTERGFDYGGYRDAVADDQWKAGFDEDVRRFDFANKLGEFAVSDSGGGGKKGGTPYTPTDAVKNIEMNLPKAGANHTGEQWKGYVGERVTAAYNAGAITDKDYAYLIKKYDLPAPK